MMGPEACKDLFRNIGRDRLKLSRLFTQPEKTRRNPALKSSKLHRVETFLYFALEIKGENKAVKLCPLANYKDGTR